MFTTVKNFFTSKVVPTVLATGRLIASAGGQLFALPRFLEFLTGNKNNPYRMPASYVAAIVNLIVNFATRVPTMFYLFSSNNKRSSNNAIPSNQTAIDIAPANRTCCCQAGQCICELGWAIPLYGALRFYGTASGLFGSLTLFLGAMTLAEFIAEQAGGDVHDAEWKEYLVQSIGLFFAVCNLASFVSTNLKKINARSFIVAKAFHDRKIPTDPAARKTLVIATMGIITTPFMSYFNATGALPKLPGMKNLSENVIRFVAINAGISFFTNQILTSVPAVYGALQPNHSHYQFTNVRKWEAPANITVHTAGFVDSVVTGANNFTGMIKTINKEFGIAETNPYLITGSAVSAGSSAALYFFFLHEIYKKDVIEEYHRRNDQIAFLPINADSTLESIIIDKQQQPIITQNPSPNYATFSQTQGIFAASNPNNTRNSPSNDIWEDDLLIDNLFNPK